MWWRKKKTINPALAAIGTAGAGALAMFLLDPRGGGRRRALIGNACVGALNATADGIEVLVRDLGNRSWGIISATGRLFGGEEQVDDNKLTARVRSHLGRVVSHPRAIEVSADQGVVTLSGPILTHEASDLISCVSGVRGVTEVRNQLETHDEAGNISALQGEGNIARSRLDILQNNPSPSSRLITGLAGGGLLAYGLLGRRDPIGYGVGVLGGLLVARAATNFGLGTKRQRQLRSRFRDRNDQAIDLQQSIEINAPIEQVYAFWRDFTNFPRFLGDHLTEVKVTGNGRSHWVAKGPVGVQAEWDAVILKDEPNRLITWESLPNSQVDTAGTVHFFQRGDNRTNIRVQMVYMPPAGTAGDVVAKLFGSDPETMIGDSLDRLKTIIESEGGRGNLSAGRLGSQTGLSNQLGTAADIGTPADIGRPGLGTGNRATETRREQPKPPGGRESTPTI